MATRRVVSQNPAAVHLHLERHPRRLGGFQGGKGIRKDNSSYSTMKIGKKIRRGIGLVFLLCVAVEIAFVGYLVISHHQPLILLSPTGAYSVGRTAYDRIDVRRVDSLANQMNKTRRKSSTISPLFPAKKVNAKEAVGGVMWATAIVEKPARRE